MSNILIYTIISVILLFSIHHIINFLFDKLTIPKTTDVLQITNQNYENIYNILKKTNSLQNNETTPINLLPSNNDNDNNDDLMKNELMNYLREQVDI